MRRQPPDRALNKMIRAEIEQTARHERVVFIDTNNEIREAVYVHEFHTGVLQAVRKRLEDAGELKAILHVSSAVLGSSGGHGTRTSIVEYLPNGQYYGYLFQPSIALPAEEDSITEAVAQTKELFGNGEGEENDQEKN